jgi:hypothetical protein
MFEVDKQIELLKRLVLIKVFWTREIEGWIEGISEIARPHP